jgi:hypothetical protein
LDNIKIIKTGINVKKILEQLKKYPEDWGNQERISGAESLHAMGYPILSAGVLQLVMGGVSSRDQYVGDSEICVPTPAIYHHTEIVGFMTRHFKRFSRCGFLSLHVGGKVGTHIDEGLYYQSRNRYHLSIQGMYRYTVGDESVVVEPGTLLEFNNKLPHSAENIGENVRITFVFDVPNNR